MPVPPRVVVDAQERHGHRRAHGHRVTLSLDGVDQLAQHSTVGDPLAAGGSTDPDGRKLLGRSLSGPRERKGGEERNGCDSV